MPSLWKSSVSAELINELPIPTSFDGKCLAVVKATGKALFTSLNPILYADKRIQVERKRYDYVFLEVLQDKNLPAPWIFNEDFCFEEFEVEGDMKRWYFNGAFPITQYVFSDISINSVDDSNKTLFIVGVYIPDMKLEDGKEIIPFASNSKYNMKLNKGLLGVAKIPTLTICCEEDIPTCGE